MWIWDCMVVASQATMGGLFWIICICLIGLFISLIFWLIEKSKSKPKYTGKPIIIQGGKKEDFKNPGRNYE